MNASLLVVIQLCQRVSSHLQVGGVLSFGKMQGYILCIRSIPSLRSILMYFNPFLMQFYPFFLSLFSSFSLHLYVYRKNFNGRHFLHYAVFLYFSVCPSFYLFLCIMFVRISIFLLLSSLSITSLLGKFVLVLHTSLLIQIWLLQEAEREDVWCSLLHTVSKHANSNKERNAFDLN